jgi:hypothetical protein
MNPLMAMMGGRNNPMAMLSQAMGMINQVRQSGNPQAMIQQMAAQNSNIKKAMDMCQGKNPEQVFKDMCRQNGIDPGQITGMMK